MYMAGYRIISYSTILLLIRESLFDQTYYISALLNSPPVYFLYRPSELVRLDIDSPGTHYGIFYIIYVHHGGVCQSLEHVL